jgi:cysteine-rich repeat protein
MSFNNALFTVDTETGAATLIGNTGQSRTTDIAFRGDGTLFSYHRFEAGTLSKTTGAATLLGPSGLSGNGNGISFAPGGDLLHADAAALHRINQTTGAATVLAPLSFPPVPCSFPRINSMDTHSSGVVYGVLNCTGGSNASNFLVTIGVPSGSVNAIAPTVPGLDGIAFAPIGACGDGLHNIGEECDDGNLLSGDCCSPTCEFDAVGTPCPTAGSPCTINRCDGAGSCRGTIPSGCAAPGKSVLMLQNSAQDAKDKLLFKWLKGAQTDLVAFGDPLNSADYALCLYTGPQRAPLTHFAIPNDSAKWQPLSTRGYRYKDKGGSAAGVTRVLLKSGAAGKSMAQVKGRGANLPDPTFSNLPVPVTAQLVNSQTNACFEAVFESSDLRKNDSGHFLAVK